MLITGSSDVSLCSFLKELKSKFNMKDMGAVHYFLGIDITQTSHGLFLSQQRYAEKILKKAGMMDCKPSKTHMEIKQLMITQETMPFAKITYFREIVGSLQYPLFTRLALAYSVNIVGQFIRNPTVFRSSLVKRIPRYLKATANWVQNIYKDAPCQLIAYSDSDWAGCPEIRRSTTGFYIF